MEVDKPLFRAVSEEEEEDQEEPAPKRARFFPPDDAKLEEDKMEIEAEVEVEKESEVIMISSDEEEEVVPVVKPIIKTKNNVREWSNHYFGELIMEGFTLYKSSGLCTLKSGEVVTLQRSKPDPPKVGAKASASKKEDTIVRFLNSKEQIVGRITEKEATWVSKLLDLNIITFKGTCVDVEKNFQSGANVILAFETSISRKAFDLPPDSASLPSTSTSKSKSFHDEAKETLQEKALRQRKSALNKIFDKINLQPIVVGSSGGGGSDSKGKGKASGSGEGKANKSKRSMVEKFDTQKKVGEDDEEGNEMNVNQLNLVYSKAIKNDGNLPEMEPADTFSLDLRGYQKQALGWMYSMESGGSNREESSIHPLWEEYEFPQKRGTQVWNESFYYNPYSGELSLEFPKASKSTRGGILADEQGLGKTIMIASLIHTSTPDNDVNSNPAVKPEPRVVAPKSDPIEPASSASGSGSDSDSDDVFVPSLAKPSKSVPAASTSTKSKSKPTQSRLNATADGKLSAVKGKGRAGGGGDRPTCTLIVCPMTLLSQWCEELERSSVGGMNVLMYYGSNRTSIQDEIDAGVQVVVTSYGTLCSDHKSSGAADDGKKSKDSKGKASTSEKSTKSRPKKNKGLFSVEWFRVVLDEAHLIKSRNTRNAKACYALQAEKRWALSGTPITNKLEDLYSLLHFIQLAPWGNFSFYKTFITAPFERKDPKALETIQFVLESVLLRREKSMKDKDGNPIVAIPKKHLKVEHLTLSDEERVIYDALYKNAKSQFLGYAAQGTVLKNVTAIFSILMRLRQAVLHPSLVLGRLASNLAAKKKLKRSIEEKAEDDDEEIVRKLLVAYNDSTEDSGKNSAKIEELMDSDLAECEVSDCIICLEPAETPITLNKCLHVACNDCMINHMAECEAANLQPRCPSCDAGPIGSKDLLEGIHLTSTKNSQKSSKKNYTTSTSSPSSSASGMTEILTLVDTSDEEENKKVKQSKSKGKGKEKAIEVEDDSEEEENYVPQLSSYRMKNTQVIQEADSDEDGSPTPGSKKVEKKGNGMSFVKDDFKSSTKLDALKNSLNEAREKDPLIKAIVFSQFTGFLDIIERMMNKEGFNHVRLDGSMAQPKREKAVSHFTKVKTSCILLASLKAGGVGLNLIAATRVYLLDCWWNIAVENQAIDRIHRFGQTKEVFITRFIVTPSIDDKMVKIQERKSRMINGALGAQSGKDQKQLKEDLESIFAD